MASAHQVVLRCTQTFVPNSATTSTGVDVNANAPQVHVCPSPEIAVVFVWLHLRRSAVLG